MRVLVDSNVLLRAAQSDHPHSGLALHALEELTNSDHEVCVVPQILYEFRVVATRPIAENGLGLPTNEARAHLDGITTTFTPLRDGPALVDQWLALVSQSDVKGKVAHDAMLIAAMQVHDIAQVLTFNVGDFARFAGVTVLDPRSVGQ